MAMATTAGTILRQFGPMVYLPTVLFALGEGAVIPLIPVMAANLGADLAFAALVASALVVGQLCGNLPAGYAVARLGERSTMVIAGMFALLASIGVVLASTPQLLAAMIFLVGFAAAVFGLARHSFMTTRVPLEFRARALALLGGSFRLGMFVGPFVAAVLVQLFTVAQSTVWFFMLCLAALIVLVLLGPDPEKQYAPVTQRVSRVTEDTGEPVTGSIPVQDRVGVFRTMWRHRRVLSRLGVAGASMAAMRSARQVVLPLWGVSLALDASSIALVVGIAGAIDFALFYASGQVMDRFGRVWAAVPAMVLMGAGFIALAFTHDGDLAVLWFGMMAAVIGVGNGLSSGVLMTLGADTAPQHDPAPYLGSWRTLGDAGGAIAPVLFSGIAVWSISVASGVIGLVGVLGAIGFMRWIPRFVPPTPH